MNLLVHTQAALLWYPGIISLMALGWALVAAPWRQLAAKSIRLHLFMASMLVLGLFWAVIGINVYDLYKIHPLILSTVVFMFGLRFSLILGAGALIIMHLITTTPWENIGFHYLGSVLTPAIVARTVLWFIGKIHIQNLFIYTLGGSFFGSMLTALASGAVSIAMLWLAGSTLLWTTLDNSYLFLMLTFPEGFCNGAIISCMAILRPDLIKTYNDKFYLDGE